MAALAGGRRAGGRARRRRGAPDAAATARPGHSTAAAPVLNLAHLDRLTDEIGIIQFSRGSNPELASGYCVDDVARLAIVAADLLAVGIDTKQATQATRWLRQSIRFLTAAYDPSGAMHNVLSYGGAWQDWPHQGDHVGRAVGPSGSWSACWRCPTTSGDRPRRCSTSWARAPTSCPRSGCGPPRTR